MLFRVLQVLLTSHSI